MQIIGLIGKKKSGKTTVANYIVELLHPRNIIIIGFADALKDEIAVAIGRSREYIELHKDNFRLILQGWGTDFRRQLISENYWVENVEISILEEEALGAHVIVIPDVRFNNEAEMIKKHSGTLIRLYRNSEYTDNHQSEIEMDSLKYDYSVNNDGNLSDLKYSVKTLLRDSLNLYA